MFHVVFHVLTAIFLSQFEIIARHGIVVTPSVNQADVEIRIRIVLLEFDGLVPVLECQFVIEIVAIGAAAILIRLIVAFVVFDGFVE